MASINPKIFHEHLWTIFDIEMSLYVIAAFSPRERAVHCVLPERGFVYCLLCVCVIQRPRIISESSCFYLIAKVPSPCCAKSVFSKDLRNPPTKPHTPVCSLLWLIPAAGQQNDCTKIMSYAYLFKYIIIGDTGKLLIFRFCAAEPLLLSCSWRRVFPHD